MSFEEKIKYKLDEYLGFNSDDLFVNDLIYIFGGSIRDILSDDKINDIDILSGSKSYSNLRNIIESNGYVFMESLYNKDHIYDYKDIHVINEPHTFINNERKIIQIIKPAIPLSESDDKDKIYKEGFFNLISNVDISSCGLSYNGALFENYPNAILHCLNKVFYINKKARMYSLNRIDGRRFKLLSRGWEEIYNEVADNRNLKIKNILDV